MDTSLSERGWGSSTIVLSGPGDGVGVAELVDWAQLQEKVAITNARLNR